MIMTSWSLKASNYHLLYLLLKPNYLPLLYTTACQQNFLRLCKANPMTLDKYSLNIIKDWLQQRTKMNSSYYLIPSSFSCMQTRECLPHLIY